MKFLFSLIFALVLILPNNSLSQIKGLSGWNIFIDPGHSQNENVGIYGYAEAKKVLRVGLNLRDLLLSKTDIDTVYISRTNDQQQVSLSQRTDYANSVGAAWYHSIHSNATSEPQTTRNSTLLLWGQYANGQEKIPNGGKAMSNVIVPILTAGYRTTTSGSWGDHDFYGTCPSYRPCPYLYINYYTSMPSELSEAGFHTNSVQNQLNMNARWKRLEAYTFFWSFLKFFKIERPFVGITTGIISDNESGQPINGAVISLNGQVDTTDTYESLFHLYSNDPYQLHNGFYFFEDLPPGNYPITVNAEGFEPFTDSVSIDDTFFTFKDIQMISNIPPYIASISPVQNDSIYPGFNRIEIIFSRSMDEASVESTLVISPSAKLGFIWSNGDKQLAINTDSLSFNTNYKLVISGNARDRFNHLFDGDGNGTGGDNFELNFKTKSQDFSPPNVVDIYPTDNEIGVELQPIINLSFNEQVNPTTLLDKIKLIRELNQTNTSVIFNQYDVDKRSVVNLFPSFQLAVNENYKVILEAGFEDIYGNKAADNHSYTFKVGNEELTSLKTLDNFENGIVNWHAPQQSDSTKGIISELTGISGSSEISNYIFGGYKSMRLNYSWDTTASSWLIRINYLLKTQNFNSSNIVQVYMFGDGTSNKFRFALKDSNNDIEVSPWYPINWIGWKLISWDMTADSTGFWIGDGILNNPLMFDSFQLTHEPGHKTTGEIYFDDLRIVNKTTVGVKDASNPSVPSSYALEQNFPNPFNPTTTIKYSVPSEAHVKLTVFNVLGREVATLVNEAKQAGWYEVKFDASSPTLDGQALSSGVYLYKISINDFLKTLKMVLVK